MDTQAGLRRLRLDDAMADGGTLYFAQVREDPLLELAALRPGPDETVVVVSSGGCTALSLLAAGAGEVVAVDLSPVQNHLVELKQAAVTGLPQPAAVAFLLGADAARQYDQVRDRLSPAARAYWDGHRRAIGKGVLNAGRSERFIGLVMGVVRRAIHPPSRIRRLFACRNLDEQRSFFAEEWDNRRWCAQFTVLLNRAVFRKAYDPSFFAHAEQASFAGHFRRTAAHTLTEIPVATNYFLHHMLTGRYPVGMAGGLPPYLVEPPPTGRLTLVDGSVTTYLRTRAEGSVHAFALSNIAEWLDPAGLDALFAEVVRTAAPGARLVFRNFVGWTEVPPRWRGAVTEDRQAGEALIRSDRSGVQRRIAVCEVNKEVPR